MSESYFLGQVRRVNRNLLLVNGSLLALLLVFMGFMALGTSIRRSWGQTDATMREHGLDSSVLQAHAAADLSNPTRLGAAEVNESRLAQLEGQAVTFSDPQAMDTMIPVWFWTERATGPRKPTLPPSYRVSQVGGRPLLILTPDKGGAAYTGVIRPLSPADSEPVKGMLMARGIQGELWPYVVDALDIGATKGFKTSPIGGQYGGAGSPTFLLLFGALLALSGWNVSKAIRRQKNPQSHPVYARLAGYGPVADIERHVNADYQRGVQVLGGAQLTSSWLLINGFWGLDAVPLNYIVWVHKNVARYHGIPIPIVFNLEILDRQRKTHVVYTSATQVENIISIITRGRPWIEVGRNSPLRRQFGTDTVGFIAAVEARRQQSSPANRT